MKIATALGGGLAGACAVTLIHESVRRIVPEAPRMDLLGMQAISKTSKAFGQKPPKGDELFTWAFAGDLISNALYYSLAGAGKDKNAWTRSAALGLAAGVGAVMLPGPLGLDKKHSSHSTATKLMTVGLYVTGALVTTAVMKLLSKRKKKKEDVWQQRLVTSAMG